MSKRTKPVTLRPSQIPITEQKPKFLLVEDDELIVRTVLRTVRQYATVITADTVEGAWRAFWQHKNLLQIIFLDGILIDGNTLELLRRIRQAKFQGEIVSITSNSQIRDSMVPLVSCPKGVNASSHGCDTHITKSEIVSHIIAHLNRRTL